ncbi:hypothetical protein GGR52DRAFT_533755 [Hypoxylon sp. FL1284]|nr:hypothetical protein GGR52DRAFT_533755 [Hypoxylon sp. FL1284]
MLRVLFSLSLLSLLSLPIQPFPLSTPRSLLVYPSTPLLQASCRGHFVELLGALSHSTGSTQPHCFPDATMPNKDKTKRYMYRQRHKLPICRRMSKYIIVYAV